MADEDELEIEEGDLEPGADGGATAGGEGDGASGAGGGDDKVSKLEAEVAALRAAGGANDKRLDSLLAMGQQFIAAQAGKGNAADPAAEKARIGAYGAKLKDLVLTGDDEDIAKFFIGSVEEVAQRKIDATLSQFGNPIADKAGAYAIQMFLDTKAAETPDKVHKAVAKNFTITESERQSLATASSAETIAFLDGKYERAAGKVLLGSASRIASPRNIGGGGSGGAGGDNVSAFPGMAAAESQRMADWVKELYPDDPVKQKKALERTIGRMKAEAS